VREVVARRRAVILPILSSETRFWLVGAAASGGELLPVKSGDGGYGPLAYQLYELTTPGRSASPPRWARSRRSNYR
jgi:hypothetical protein